MKGKEGKVLAMDLVLTGPLCRHDIPALCHRARVLLEASRDRVLVCDVGGLAGCDAVVVDALARLKLIARRNGSDMQVRAASRDLTELLAFVGLSDVLPIAPG